MKVLLSVLCIPALVGLVALMRYETLEPCGMFRAEAKRFVLFELTAGGAGEVFEGLGAAPGITMLDNILEATTASMAPVDCLQALVRLHTNDNPSEVLSTLIAGESLNAGLSAPRPTWRFIVSTDLITDKLLERASVQNGDGDSFWIYPANARLNAGFQANNYYHDDENELVLRVDNNPAFTGEILSNDDTSVFIGLTEDQVGQLKGGSELLVRYDSIAGRGLARFPLRGSTGAIEQITWRPEDPDTLALDAEQRRLAELRWREDSERLQAAEAARLARERERQRDGRERLLAEAEAQLAGVWEAEARRQREEQDRLAWEAEEELRRAEESSLRREYISLIVNRMERHWILPRSAKADLECEVQLTLTPSGDIVDTRVVRCNGSDAVIRSIETAVSRSSPLPPPPVPSLYERSLNIVFTPSS